MVVDLDHETAGTFRQIGSPIKLREHPAQVRTPSPRLGQHTAVYLEEAGFTTEQIRELMADGVAANGS